MTLKMKVEKKKNGRDLEKVLKHLKSLNSLSIDVGYFEEQGVHSRAKVLYSVLMAWHEYGMGNYPARPLMNTAADLITASAKNKGLNSYIIDTVRQVGSLKNNSNKLGNQMKEASKTVFGNSGFLESNAQSTIDRKGFNMPLIDSLELMKNLAYRSSITKEVNT